MLCKNCKHPLKKTKSGWKHRPHPRTNGNASIRCMRNGVFDKVSGTIGQCKCRTPEAEKVGVS